MAENTEEPVVAYRSFGLLDELNENNDSDDILIRNTITGRVDKTSKAALIAAAGGNQNLQQVLEQGSTGNVDTPIIMTHGSGDDISILGLIDGYASLETANNKFDISDSGASVQSNLSIGASVNDYDAVQRQEVENLLKNYSIPSDIYIGTNPVGTTLTYKTDIYRTLDLQPFVSVTITNTNEIVRINETDFFITGNFIDNSTPAIGILLKGGKIINNVLSFDSYDSSVLDISKIHGLIYNRGFVYGLSRPNDAAVATKVIKINPYNMQMSKVLTLPVGGTYAGNPNDLKAYKNNLYFIMTLSSGSGAGNLIQVDEDLNTYTPLFQVATVSTRRIISDVPFEIYNDRIYFPTLNNVDADLRANTIGFSVYNFKGEEIQFVSNLPISTGKTLRPYPHWITIYNGKIFLATSGSQFRSMIRADVNTLAIEQIQELTNPITDENSIDRFGFIYVNEENTTGARLLRMNSQNLADYTVEIENYNGGFGSYGSINPLVNVDSQIKNISAFINDSGYGTVTSVSGTSGQISVATGTTTPVISIDPTYTASKQATLVSGTNIKTVNGNSLLGSGDLTISGGGATNLTYTASPTNGIVVSDTGTDATIPSADGTNAGLLLPAEKAIIATAIVNGGNTTGATINIGSNDAQTVAFEYNNTAVMSLIGTTTISFANTTTLQNAVSSRGSLTMGASGASMTATRNTADSMAAMVFNKQNTSVFGNIVSFNAAGSIVSGVYQDGRAFGADATASNDFATLGQLVAINDTTTAFTKATLNSTYASAKPGLRVICKNIGSGMIYTKASGTDWLSTSAMLMT